MIDNKHKDPLHGVTLEMILNNLVEKYGWDEMSRRIRIKCFANNPSIKSSLVFLRRTPWARKKVENLYISAPKSSRLNIEEG
jgi:uncharacterized protein (DUF2132 family)